MIATIYSQVNGEQIQRLIARTREAQLGLDEATLKGFARAEGRLGAHRRTGNSRVTIEEGIIDRYLVLEDPGGNALAIEFGHQPSGWDKDGKKPVRGLRVLRDAFPGRPLG